MTSPRLTIRIKKKNIEFQLGGGGYGTFAIESAKRAQPYVVRREYPGAGTLPQVAYQTLIAALDYIQDCLLGGVERIGRALVQGLARHQ